MRRKDINTTYLAEGPCTQEYWEKVIMPAVLDKSIAIRGRATQYDNDSSVNYAGIIEDIDGVKYEFVKRPEKHIELKCITKYIICSCGNDVFHTTRTEYIDCQVEVDTDYDTLEILDGYDDPSEIQPDEPYGAFTCTNCGKTYETLLKSEQKNEDRST